MRAARSVVLGLAENMIAESARAETVSALHVEAIPPLSESAAVIAYRG
jgi:hypothetical protein